MSKNLLIKLRREGEGADKDGQYWSEEDRKKLVNLFYAGWEIGELAILFQRTEPSVMQQLNSMGCFEREIKRRSSYTKRYCEECCKLKPNSIECKKRRGEIDCDV